MTIPEKVQLHMVIAVILFQYTTRNSVQLPFDWGAHYRYALGFYKDLATEASLPSLQAIALICTALRGFPKPGAAWLVSSHALATAIEMGLHRSVTAWKDPKPEMSAHEIEMRKRVFWSILCCHVIVGTKLGRPLAIHLEDFDVQIPKIVHDNLPEEADNSDWQKCSFRPFVVFCGWLAVMMQLHGSVCTIRSTQQSHDSTLGRLEKDLDAWIATIPPELRGNSQGQLEDRVFAMYLDFSAQHLRLLLHHPALSRSQIRETATRNLDICLDASGKLLQLGTDMSALKSLDTTWYNATVFIAAIFTTLFVWSERKDQITLSELNDLKVTMDSWLSLMGDIGSLLGKSSSQPFQDACLHFGRNWITPAEQDRSNHIGSHRKHQQAPGHKDSFGCCSLD